jgi:ATPase subunit of ABC transporter with duplicated ATPase domains
MSLVRLENVSKSYDGNAVLRDVWFRLDVGDRVGLIGRNGTGKTTVLKLILGQEQPTMGTVEVNQGLTTGYFSQFSELVGETSIAEVLDGLFADIHAIEAELAEIDTALGRQMSDEAVDRLVHRQAILLEEMDHREGWNYRVRIDTALTRLGFSAAHRGCPIDQLSGGWRNRAALAKILLEEPDVLLMDEPTNYLDIEGLQWLEEWFRTLPGASIIVSHDRHFLDRVVNRIVEIENYHFQEYEGSFTQYVREKPFRLKSLQRQFEHEEELLAFEAEAIADRREAVKDPSKAYDGHLLFDDLTFEIQRSDRICIVGPNGCGKSTLLRVLTEEDLSDSGRVVWNKGATYAYYNQVFEELDPGDTVTHAVNITDLAYRAPRKQVNRFLSLFQFSEMDLTQRIGTLSGGQRARVALAKCLLSGAGVIILDEPTNHLDMLSTQVTERALMHFPGAVIIVSHDRFFIDKIATRMLVFRGDGIIEEIAGNWTIWQASRERTVSYVTDKE